MGRKRIAQTLARAGLHLSTSTVGRMLKDRHRDPEPFKEAEAAFAEKERTDCIRTVTAKRPNHFWHVDLTVVPTASGFWAPWYPLALHRYGSIAVIERFIKSLKDEWLRRLVTALRFETMRNDLSACASWFNEHRPHQALGGSTPHEVYGGRTTANQTRRFEPRTKWPVRREPAISCTRLSLSVTHHDGRRHLPIIELKQAA